MNMKIEGAGLTVEINSAPNKDAEKTKCNWELVKLGFMPWLKNNGIAAFEFVMIFVIGFGAIGIFVGVVYLSTIFGRQLSSLINEGRFAHNLFVPYEEGLRFGPYALIGAIVFFGIPFGIVISIKSICNHGKKAAESRAV